MPTIVTKKAGTCTAIGCGGRIREGEFASYTRVQGLRHPECANKPTERRNAKPGQCITCDRWLEVGQGLLHLRKIGRRSVPNPQRYTLTCSECRKVSRNA